MPKGLDDVPISVLDDIADLLPSERYKCSLSLVARRYTRPAQKALVRCVLLAPGTEVEKFTDFLGDNAWAAHSVRRLWIPSRAQEAAYISGRAATKLLRLTTNVTHLSLRLPAAEFVRLVLVYREIIRDVRLVYLSLSFVSSRGSPPPQARERAALELVAASASTLRQLHLRFGRLTVDKVYKADRAAHLVVDGLSEPFQGEPVEMQRLVKLHVDGGSSVMAARIATASPHLRLLDLKLAKAGFEAYHPTTLARIWTLRLRKRGHASPAEDIKLLAPFTSLRTLVVDGKVQLEAIPRTVAELELNDHDVETWAMANALSRPGWLPGLKKLIYSCEHPDEDEVRGDSLNPGARETHDSDIARIEQLANERGISLEFQ